MIVVSGCPRSGTSLCMDLHREVYGGKRILGSKFPRLTSQKDILDHEGYDENAIKQINHYINKKHQSLLNNQDSKDMNPNGFWECQFSVRGIFYQYKFKDILEKLSKETQDNESVCKIVSQGLLDSDVQYISKIVYMLRHPRAVAKSQERLKRGLVRTSNGNVQELFDGVTFHTPEMFINVTIQACHFFLAHPDLPVLFVQFEDLVTKPEAIIKQIGDFENKDFSKAISLVEPKLNRSKHEDIDNLLWEDAEFIYKLMIKAADYNNNGDREAAEEQFKAIIKYVLDPRRETNRQAKTWPCFRLEQNVREALCKSCKFDQYTKINLRQTAEEMNIRWWEEPCLFECGMNLDDDQPISIEESIKNNFWAPEHQKHLQDTEEHIQSPVAAAIEESIFPNQK